MDYKKNKTKTHSLFPQLIFQRSQATLLSQHATVPPVNRRKGSVKASVWTADPQEHIKRTAGREYGLTLWEWSAGLLLLLFFLYEARCLIKNPTLTGSFEVDKNQCISSIIKKMRLHPSESGRKTQSMHN